MRVSKFFFFSKMKTFSLTYVNTMLDLEDQDTEEAKEWFRQYFEPFLQELRQADEPTLIHFVKQELGFLGAPVVFVMELLQDYRPTIYDTLETLMDQEHVEDGGYDECI